MCDTVVNKVFKAAMKASFRDYLHERFDEYMEQLPTTPDPALWHPLLTMGALKPHICGFVGYAIHALRTDEMKATIQRAFAEDGLFAEIRGPLRQQEAAAALQLIADALPAELVVPDEEEQLAHDENLGDDAGIDELLAGFEDVDLEEFDFNNDFEF
jgi:hypothetical protein